MELIGEPVFFFWKGKVRFRRLREVMETEEGLVANFTVLCGATERIWIPINEVFKTKEELIEYERNKRKLWAIMLVYTFTQITQTYE